MFHLSLRRDVRSDKTHICALFFQQGKRLLSFRNSPSRYNNRCPLPCECQGRRQSYTGASASDKHNFLRKSSHVLLSPRTLHHTSLRQFDMSLAPNFIKTNGYVRYRVSDTPQTTIQNKLE